MKKIMLLVIGCLAYVSVQAQSVTTEAQIKKAVDARMQKMTSEVKFSDAQKAYLADYFIYLEKEKAGTFTEELKASALEDVNMDTFFTDEQRKVIQKNASQIAKNLKTSTTLMGSDSKF